MMRTGRWLAALAALVVFGGTARAQGLRAKFTDLFVFGSGGIQLFLPGTADPNNPATTQAHGNHFIPAVVGANGALISFLGNAIASSAAHAPVSAANSGTTFRFVDGAPVATSVSSGPLFAERAPTLGKGRVFVGFNRNAAHYSSLRGVPLNDLRLTFTHQNVTEASSPGCSAAQGANCDLMGVPRLENDLMLFQLNLDVDVVVTSFFVTYGLTDKMDISFALPVVSASLQGQSDAEIIPFGGPPAVHFFGGTETNPVLHATRSVSGNATGMGDVAARLKYNLSQTDRAGFSVLVDGRFTTGNPEDLLGTGHATVGALAIISARFGDFTPHTNLGYVYRTGHMENSALLATVGFDHRMAPWATLAADLISEVQVGANKLRLPSTVHYQAPYVRQIEPSEIPEIRDNLVSGSFGFKFRTVGELTGVTNAIIPINRAGLRSNLIWSFGIEYGF
jgi:hypothetical protein